MVGILRADVTAAAIGDGTHSSTMEKQPADCKANAWSKTCVPPYTTTFKKREQKHSDLKERMGIEGECG